MLYKFSSDSLCKFDFRFDFHLDKPTSSSSDRTSEPASRSDSIPVPVPLPTSSSDAAFQSIVYTYNITVIFTGNYCADHVVCIYVDKLYRYLYSVLYAVYIRVYVYNKLPQNKTIMGQLLRWMLWHYKQFTADHIMCIGSIRCVYSTVNLLHNHCIFSIYINRYIINLIHIYISKYTVILQWYYSYSAVCLWVRSVRLIRSWSRTGTPLRILSPFWKRVSFPVAFSWSGILYLYA